MKFNLSYGFYDLPLSHPFTISRYTVNVQKTLIVCITDGFYSGYGEATVNPYYHSTQEKLTTSMLKIKPLVEANSNLHPAELWQMLSKVISDDYFALAAADMAYWDFFSRKNGKTLRSYWSDDNVETPLTSYTIAIDSLEMMQQKIIEKSWPIYKIKLGMSEDLEIVKKLRKVTDAVFRVDANCAWSAQQTIENSKVLRDFNVEFIEQPLKADDFIGMKQVRQQAVLPIIADESCQKEEDVIICAKLFHGVNIKLMKCGGITPALRIIDHARKIGLRVMAGCMTESTVGISGLCQIAPLLDDLDADGALLLEQDIALGVTFNFGKIIYSNDFGTGAKMLQK